MMKKNIVIFSILILVSIGLAGCTTTVVEKGGGMVSAGLKYFPDGAIIGGDVVTLTSSGQATSSADQICRASVLKHDPTASTTKLYLPSAATMIKQCLPSAGMFKTLRFKNTSTDDAHDVFTVNNTTTDILTKATSSFSVTVEEGKYGRLTLTNIDGTNMLIEAQALVDGD
jgi:hypothetical protein